MLPAAGDGCFVRAGTGRAATARLADAGSPPAALVALESGRILAPRPI